VHPHYRTALSGLIALIVHALAFLWRHPTDRAPAAIGSAATLLAFAEVGVDDPNGRVNDAPGSAWNDPATGSEERTAAATREHLRDPPAVAARTAGASGRRNAGGSLARESASAAEPEPFDDPFGEWFVAQYDARRKDRGSAAGDAVDRADAGALAASMNTGDTGDTGGGSEPGGDDGAGSGARGGGGGAGRGSRGGAGGRGARGGRSSGAGLGSNSAWDCDFPFGSPPRARVRMVVMVLPDGSPESVEIVSDPGHGFAQAARECAMKQRFQPARDEDGEPTRGATPPFNVLYTH
jgi:protein TonB